EVAFGNFSASRDGVLVYSRENTRYSRLIWADRQGKESPAIAEPGLYFVPRLSPDATKVALLMIEPQTANQDIWQIDLLHGIATRFTFDPAADSCRIWSPDGRQIAFSSSREGKDQLYMKPTSGTSGEERISPRSDQTRIQYPNDWSRDGRYILYTELG